MLRTLARTLLATGALVAVTGCDDSDTDTDAGVQDAAPLADANGFPDAFVADATPRPDAGPRPDSGVEGRRCAPEDIITIGSHEVQVDKAETIATVEGGAPDLTCVGERPPNPLAGGVTFRSCLRALGGSLTRAEIENDLTFAVFESFDDQGVVDLVDPSKDAIGADRTPERRIAPDVVVSENSDCPSGFQVELGRSAGVGHRLKTDYPYAIRVSATSSTSAAADKWASTLNFNVRLTTANLESGAGLGGNCSPEVCRGRTDLVLATQAWVQEQTGRLGATVVGGANLRDGQGDGYGLILTNDCKDNAMMHATGGFLPAATEAGYLGSDGTASTTAKETSELGLLLGVGFAHTSSTGPASVYGAVGATETGLCTEEYAGGEFFVFPDTVSVWRSTLANTIR